MLGIHKAIVTVFGAGYSPKAPGTAGALVAVIFLYFFPVFQEQIILLIGLAAVLTLVGTYSTSVISKHWEKHDASEIVIDEFIGILITMAFIPVDYKFLIIGFILFRFFDILKPLGIRTIDEKMDNAFGVMLDDILAGVYANLSLQLIVYFFFSNI